MEHKIRITNFFVSAAVTDEKYEELRKNLDFALEMWRKSGELALKKDRVYLGYGLGFFFLFGNNDFEKHELFMEQVIEEARRFKDYDALSRLLVDFASTVGGRENETKSLRLYQEAQSMLADDRLDIRPLNRHRGKLCVALAMHALGTPGLEPVIDESMDYFLKKGPRYGRAIYAFNTAMAMKDSDTQKALFYFDLSLREAREIGHKGTIAYALSEKAHIANKLGNYREAEIMASEAVDLTESGIKFWHGWSLYTLAYAQRKLKQPEKALSGIKKALPLMPDDLAMTTYLVELRASIEEEQGRYRQALESRKELEKMKIRKVAENEKEHFAK
ncbi:MAG: tetratricopeptide repeat protein, partial [Pseudobdellovibrionaceae bacterium]|nr:tetratricopeptide repeat protein [Pseudobdellovibrionaceae bacterium]